MSVLKKITIILLGISTSAGVLAAGLDAADDAQSSHPFPPALATKTPYLPLQDWKSYQRPPEGYQPIFTEMVARHGSRLLTGDHKDVISFHIWLQAKKENALTPLGESLGNELASMVDVNQRGDYGALTQLGKEQHQLLAQRLYQRNQKLFEVARQQGRKITVLTSGQSRVIVSARYFMAGLQANQPALAAIMTAPKTNKALLYFHSMPTSDNYRKYLKHDQQLANTLKSIENQPRTHDAALRILRGIYTKPFIDKLVAGTYKFSDGESDPKTYNDIDAARALYDVYAISAGMGYEGRWDFARYVPARAASWFAYLADAKDFYQKGPGFVGRDMTYRMAKPLEDDFFTAIDRVMQDPATAEVARLRFTHAEEIIPFAALMQLPGSDTGAYVRQNYSWGNNPWRGDWVAPMAANIQWDVYRNARNQYAVRMLYNEKETPFKADCQPIAAGSHFYDINELKRCYHHS